MPSLVSPGVSVTVIDESFYIPASAPTVPLFFVATQAGKLQPDGETDAEGTNEHSVVRTVTSIGQSVQLYGVPYFWKDSEDGEFHGDARNEYGLFALNQFLGIGNRAYVTRANIDLTDAATSFVSCGVPTAGTATLTGVGNGTIGSITASSAFVLPQTISVVFNTSTTFTVIGSLDGVIGSGTVGVAFTSTKVNFTVTAGSTAFVGDDYFQFALKYTHSGRSGTGNGTFTALAPDPLVSAIGAGASEVWTITFTSATAFGVSGSVAGPSTTGTVGTPYDNAKINFTITAGSTAFTSGDTLVATFQAVTAFNPLGSTDALKRAAIVTALQAEVNINSEVRSELYEYNLIVCPGYPELVDELVALSVDINEEAFVIADTPCDKTSDQTATWALTNARTVSTDVAYYYPWGIASNLDGRDVLVAPSGIALRTYAYSDNQTYVWQAPAGARRGLVTGVSEVGYVTGTLGTATTFVTLNANQGQRDNLYESAKNINPIVFFPGEGLLVFGQKTSASSSSALDRVNVMRLVMYLKRALRKGAFPFIFEPNDKITRDNLKAAADGLLNDVMAKRGLYDFVTLCDDSNNTAARIDANEMYLDVAIKPVKTAEFIYIPMRVLSTGAQLPG